MIKRKKHYNRKEGAHFAGILLFFFLFSLLLVGCRGGKPPYSEELSDIPITEYTLIRSDSSEDFVLRQVLNIKAAIEERFQVSVSSSTDWKCEDNSGQRKEILVGVTNREESIAANEELENVQGYIIRCVNDRIVITGSTEQLLEQAVDLFVNKYLAKPYTATLPRDLEERYVSDSFRFFDENGQGLILSVPENATEAVQVSARVFADAACACFGLPVEVEWIPEEKGQILLGSVGQMAPESPDLSTVQESTGAGAPAATPYAGADWLVSYENDRLKIWGKNDMNMTAALAGALEYMKQQYNRTLTGVGTVYCEKDLSFGGRTEGGLPRIIGGRFLLRESISSRCYCSYYEHITEADLENYRNILTKGYGFIFVSASADGKEIVYCSKDKGQKITLNYNKEKGFVSLLENDC